MVLTFFQTWQARLKKTEVELKLLKDVDMLLVAEEGVRGGTCQAIHRNPKANRQQQVYERL